MYIKLCTRYLSKVQKVLISNEIILLLLSIIELLPIIYNSIISSFYFTNNKAPKYFSDYVVYFSYYDKFHEKLHKHYEIYYSFIIVVFYSLFIVYKVFFIEVSIKNHKWLHAFIINFYEFGMFRIFSIILLDFIIYKVVNGTFTVSLFSLVFGAFVIFVIYQHFYSETIYLNFEAYPTYFIDNKLHHYFDNLYLAMKLIICFIKSTDKNEFLLNFLNLSLLLSNLFLFLLQTYLVLYNKFVFIIDDIGILAQYLICCSLCFFELYLIVINNNLNFYGILGIFESLFLGFYLTFFLRKFSIKKLFDKDNGLGMILYLFKHKYSPKINHIISFIGSRHTFYCHEKGCKFCQKIKMVKDEKNPIENMITFLYLYKVKKESEINKKKYKDYREYYYLVELYCTFLLRKQNIISIVMKYQKIKNLASQSTLFNSKYTFDNRFSFLINLELLLHEITKNIKATNETCKISYLITIDTILNYIHTFLSYVKKFFDINIINPIQIIKLATKYTQLRKKVDCKYLINKDNRGNYSCILATYIMEQIFNDRVNSNYYISEIITSFEEIFNAKYQEDDVIFAKFEIANAVITIEQSGKELIDLRGEEFKKIFPSFLANDGNKKLITILTSKNENYFEYYIENKTNHTIEKFKMKFIELQSLDVNQHSVYLLCQYVVDKEYYLFFKNTSSNTLASQKILISFSEKIGQLLRIKPEQLSTSNEIGSCLLKEDLFDDKSVVLNLKKTKRAIRTKLGLTHLNIHSSKILIASLSEVIPPYEIYLVKPSGATGQATTVLSTLYDNPYNNERSIITNDKEANFEFDLTHTAVSSSVMTNSIFSTYSKTFNTIKKEQSNKYQNFFLYTQILIGFNCLIVIIIGIFLGIQLSNDSKLEKTFTLIKNYNDFQSYFFHAVLSVFSLTCNADYLTQTVCVNQFTEFCYDFSMQNGLTEKEMMNEYLARELPYKAELVVNALKTWESDRYMIDSPELEVILNDVFVYDTINEFDLELSIISYNLTFEEAIKRSVNTIYMIPRYDNHLTAVIWTITIDGNGYFDLTNIKLDKEPINGIYLTEVQKLYYNMLINFQKFLLRFFSMTDILHNYYDNTIKSTLNQVMAFLIVFIMLHFIMVIFGFMLSYKFKHLHLDFYIILTEKINHKDFMKYFFDKIDLLQILSDLYRDNPNKIIEKITKAETEESKRLKRDHNLTKKQETSQETDDANKLLNKAEREHLSIINHIYNFIIIKPFITKLILLFFGYFVICIILYILLLKRGDDLFLMNSYIKAQYGASNNIYINLALVQMMSLTNQTDIEMEKYFNAKREDNPNRPSNDGYVRKRIQDTFYQISSLQKMEKSYSFLYPLSSIIYLQCDSLYLNLDDPIITAMTNGYPESDYTALLGKYCYVYSNLRQYPDDKMAMSILTYKTSKVLDLFVDQTYDTYAVITNCLLIYQIYTEVLMIIRPIRRYLYINLLGTIIKDIIWNYSLIMIIFLIFNGVYELIILVVVKKTIINNIVNMSREIIIVAKAFECF